MGWLWDTVVPSRFHPHDSVVRERGFSFGPYVAVTLLALWREWFEGWLGKGCEAHRSAAVSGSIVLRKLND